MSKDREFILQLELCYNVSKSSAPFFPGREERGYGLPARAYINEMAHRVARGEELESPYQYSCRLNQEIGDELKQELEKLSQGQGPP